VFEDAKVDRLLVRLHCPRDGVVGLCVDPAHEIALSVVLSWSSVSGWTRHSYLAMYLDLFHSRHGRQHCY
jgi:hypothetical protein